MFYSWNGAAASAAAAATASTGASSALLRAYGPGQFAASRYTSTLEPIHYSSPPSNSAYHIRATFNARAPPPPPPPKPPRTQNTFMNTAALGQSDLGLTSLMSNLPPDSASNSVCPLFLSFELILPSSSDRSQSSLLDHTTSVYRLRGGTVVGSGILSRLLGLFVCCV